MGTKQQERNKAWSKDECRTLYQLRREGVPYKLIGIELGRSSRSCEYKYNNTIWEKTEFYDEKVENLDEKNKKRVLESIAKCADRKLDAYKMRAEIIGDKISKSIQALPKVSPPAYKKTKTKKVSQHEEEMGIMISDSHIGHTHSLEDTGGISEYNLDIFDKRTENLKKAVAEIYELHSHLYKIPILHMFCLGDMVAGMNAVGNWSPIYINLPIWDQMVHGFHALENMIFYWLGIFEKIHFYGTRGNHSRIAPANVEKDYVNWDFICYRFLKERFRDNDRVIFHSNQNAWWLMEEIKNHKFLMIHGDDVKYSGNALNSINNFQKDMSGILKTMPDYILAGHFHTVAELTASAGNKILINGSFVGADVYSLKTLHRFSRPEQKIFGIHEKRGITWKYDIDLDVERK